MSSNISGFQGVNTPLQSMTNGKYTLADYTKMNTLFGARITALEKAVAFNPNNVTISGYVNVQPNASNSGTLQTAGGAQIGGNLQVNKSLTVTENAYIGGSLQVSGALSFASLAVNTFTSNTINNSGLTTSNSFSGNGAALTAVPAVSVPYSGLTGAVPTWNQNTAGNAATATNVAYSGLTGAVPTWNQSTTGNAATATNVPYSGLTGAIPIWNQNTTGNAATATSASDKTRLSLSGGSMTGQINAQNILFAPNSQAYNYKRNRYSSFNNLPAGIYTPTQQNGSVHDYVRLEFNNACTVDLAALTIINNTYYQDKQRFVTVTKKAVSLGPFAVTLLPPTGYLFYDATLNGAATYAIPSGVFSVTFLISNFSGNVVDLIGSV